MDPKNLQDIRDLEDQGRYAEAQMLLEDLQAPQREAEMNVPECEEEEEAEDE